jgi:hypothetical protein
MSHTEFAITAQFTLSAAAAKRLKSWVRRNGGHIDMLESRPTSAALLQLGLPFVLVSSLVDQGINIPEQFKELDEPDVRRLRGVGRAYYRRIVQALAGLGDPVLLKDSPLLGDLLELLDIDDEVYLDLRVHRQWLGRGQVAFRSIPEVTALDPIGLVEVIDYDNVVKLLPALTQKGHTLAPHLEHWTLLNLLTGDHPLIHELKGAEGVDLEVPVTDLNEEFLLGLVDKGISYWYVHKILQRLETLGYISAEESYSIYKVAAARDRELREARRLDVV